MGTGWMVNFGPLIGPIIVYSKYNKHVYLLTSNGELKRLQISE